VSDAEEFETVRREPDPIRRGRRATELLTLYQQRATELARLRREAIEQAHDERAMSYTEIAAELGITKGRVTQIRSDAPRRERAFFGVGPVAIGIPYRYQSTDRERPLIAAEDAQAGEQIERVLTSLGFAISRFQIEPDSQALPPGDAVVVCGPKSAPAAAALIERDATLCVEEHDDRWWITDRRTGERFGSPVDDTAREPSDLAYVARHRLNGHVVLHISGLHAIGSLGAVHYLSNHLDELFDGSRDMEFSCVIRSTYDGLRIIDSELIVGPVEW
jgi:hypothetical protein